MAKSNTPIKTRFNAASWAKNMGKSLGLSTKDIMKEMAPTTIETAESFNESMKDIISSVKNAKKPDVNSAAKSFISKNKDLAKTALKNAKEDIRTGNIYNKERVEATYAIDDIDFDFDSGDLDFSDDFDDSSFEDSDSGSSTKVVVPNVTVNSNINGNNPMVGAVMTQTEVIMESTKATLSQDAVLAKSSMELTKEVGSSLYEGVSAINSNLGKMLNFQSSVVTNYMNSSLKYYEDSLKIMTDFVETYKNNIGANLKEEEKRNAYTQDAINMYSGSFNLPEYMKLVKNQFKGYASNNLALSFIMNAATDEDSLAGLAAQPLKFISDKIIKTAIPKFFEETIKEFDKSLSAFFPALGMKLFGWSSSDNPILSAIGQIFGIKTDNKSSIDTSKFNKGPIPFNGITQKSIVEVIPGYLSKILSAVSGREAELFDMETGRFKKISDIKADHDMTVRSRVTGDYEYLNEIKDSIQAFGIQDSESRKALNDKIDQLFMKITDTNKLVNIFKNGGEELSELLDSLDGGLNNGERTIIKNALLTLDKSKLMRTFGLDAMKSRTSKSQLFYDIESGSNSALSSLFNGLFSEDEMKSKNVTIGKPKSSLFSPEDEHGHTSLYYLRSIYKTLLNGIKVFVAKTKVSGEYKGDSLLSDLLKEDDKYKASLSVNTSSRVDITDKMRADAANKGGVLYQDTDSMYDLSDEEAARIIKNYKEYNKESSTSKPSKAEKFMPKTVREAIGKLRNTISRGPARILNGFVDKMNSTMFEVIFGKQDGEEPKERQSLITRMINSTSEKLDTFFDYIDKKFFEPIKDALFGDNGLFTRFKKSETYGKMKSGVTRGIDYLFGVKDEENIRRGGVFSETGAAISDMSKSIKYYFTGSEYKDSKGVTYPKNPNSVFGEVRNIFTGFKSTMREYFFGDKDADGKEKAKGILSSIGTELKKGFQNFSDALFGPKEINGKKNSNYLAVGELGKKIKERMPKSLATGIFGAGAGLLLGGKLGILGSLLLPGGPIGGAVVGTTLGFLSQSDRFKNWLFGEQDEKTKERVGGLISKSTQEFFKKHKAGLVGGATIGTLKGALGFGLLPGFIFGGPIGGALMGMGTSLLFRSQKFQDLLFGEEVDGKRSGGFLSKIFKRDNVEDVKKRAGTIGAGAIGGLGIGAALSHFGLLGAFAFGPLSGAIIGAAAGISLTSEKWKKALFGEMDVDEVSGKTYRKGGLLTKFSNMINIEVIQPLKIGLLESKFKFQNWFEENVEEKILNSIDPFRQEIDNIKTNIKESFTILKDKIMNSNVIQKAKEYMFDPIVEGFRDYVIQPFRRLTNFLIGGASKIIGGIAKAPFSALEFVANRLAAKHERAGISAYRGKIVENLKNTEVGRAFTIVADGVDWIKEKAVNLTKSFLSTLGEGVKMIVRGAFKTLSTVIQAPFKLLAAPFKAVGNLRKNIRSNRGYDVEDQSLLDQISNGDRGFFQSIGDFIRLATPGSQLRHDARYSDEGAGYQSERQRKRQERADARAAKRQQRADILANAKSQLDANRQLAKKLGYDNVDKNGKFMGNLYGRKYRKLSQDERDRFAEDKLRDTNINLIETNTKKTNELLEKYLPQMIDRPTTNSVNNHDMLPNIESTEENAPKLLAMNSSAKFFKAAIDANEKEEEEEQKEENALSVIKQKYSLVTQKTAKNLQAANILQSEKEQEQSWRQRMVDLLSHGNRTRDEHKTGWDSIFSKKGLIGSALILALPLITKFLQDPSSFGQWVGDIISEIDFSDIARKIVDGIKQALGLGNKGDSENRTDAAGDVNSSSYGAESLTDVAVYGVRKGAITLKNIGAKIKNITSVNKNMRDIYKQLKSQGYSKRESLNIIKKAKQAGKKVANDLGSSDEIAEAMWNVFDEKTSDAVFNNADDFARTAASYTDDAFTYADDFTRATTSSADNFYQYGKKLELPQSATSVVDDFAVHIDDATTVIGKGTSKSKLASETIDVAFTDVGDDVLTAGAKSSDNIIKRFITEATKAVKTLKDKAITKFNISPKVFSKIDDLLPKFLKPSVLGKYVGKIGKTIVKALSSTAFAVAVTGYGAITGATKTETAHLFKIPVDSVDGTMQLISGFFKGLLNTGPMVFVDLINVIVNELFGINFIAMLATAIYTGIKHNDEEALEKFSAAQSTFGEDYNDYTITQQIAKGNVEYDDDGNILTDDEGKIIIKDPSLVESENSYNDRVNKSVAGKLWDSMKNSGFNIKSKLFGNKGDDNKLSNIHSRKLNLEEAADKGIISRDSESYKMTLESLNKEERKYTETKGIFSGFLEGMSKIVDSLKNSLSSFGKESKKLFSNILSGKLSSYSTEYWTPPSDKNEDGEISKILFYAQRVLTLPISSTLSICRSAYDRISKFVKTTSAVLKFSIQNKIDSYSDIKSGNTIFTSEYWTPPTKNSSGDSIGGLGQILFYAQRFLSLPSTSVLSVIYHASDGVRNVINGVKSKLSDTWSAIKDSNLGEKVFSSEYWTPPESDDTPLSGIGKVLFYTSRLMTFSPLSVVSVGKFAVNHIKSFIGRVKDLKSLIKTYGDVTEDDLGDDYFTFNGDNKDNSISSGVEQAAFFITRALMYPVLSIKKIFKPIVDKIKSKIDSVKKWFDFEGFLDGDYSFGGGQGGENSSSGPIGLLNDYRVNSEYGYRTIEGDYSFHKGIDLSKGVDNPIPSFMPGTVTFVDGAYSPNSGYYGSKDGGGYGNHVAIKDKYGHTHIYAHLNKVDSRIKEGATVKMGQPVGLQGHTGNSTGPHLHYQINSNGFDSSSHVDPVAYLKKHNSGNEQWNGDTSVLTSDSSSTSGSATIKTGISGAISQLSSIISDSMSPLSTLSTSLTDLINPLFGTDNYPDDTNGNAPTTTYIDPKLGYTQFLHQNLQSFNPISEAELNAWISNSGNPSGNFIGNGKVFLDASNETGLDPRYIVSHAALESAWGTSAISRDKNNYFGIGAYDSSPYASAYKFNSGLASGIIEGAKWIDKNYTEAGQDTLYKMRFNNGVHQYATDPEWANKIAKIMATAPQPSGTGGELDTVTPNYSNISTFKSNKSYQQTKPRDDKQDDNNNSIFFEKMVQVLIEIAENTGSSSETLSELKEVMSEKSNNSINVNKKTEVKYGGSSNTKTKNESQKDYQTAKAIARGTPA